MVSKHLIEALQVHTFGSHLTNTGMKTANYAPKLDTKEQTRKDINKKTLQSTKLVVEHKYDRIGVSRR